MEILVFFFNIICYLSCVQSLDKVFYSNFKTNFELVNELDECVIFILNFQGLDIPPNQISAPLILLRYFSFVNDFFVYPYELVSFHDIKTSEFFEDISDIWDALMARNISSVLTDQKGLDYVNLPYHTGLKLANKNRNCEAKVYLHPPNKEISPYMYHNLWSWGAISLIKDPFLIESQHNSYELRRNRKYYIGNNAKYSLLICNNNQESICLTENNKYNWIVAATRARIEITTFEVLLIQLTNNNGHYLQLFCQYCVACDPFKLISISYMDANRTSIFKKLASYIANVLPSFVGIVSWWTLEDYKNLLSKENRTRQQLLARMPDSQPDFFPSLIHVHALDMIIYENISLEFIEEIQELRESRAVLKSKCSLSRAMTYPAKLISFIDGKSELHVGFHQELGLVFQSTQLRFVSCHREQNGWINQLNELLLAFDLWTWILIFGSCLIIAYLHTLTTRCAQKLKRVKFRDSCFSLYMSIVDQSTQIFSRSEGSKLLLCALPFAFLVLSNEYKGDNITRLTLEPSLIPFDTFKSLIDNNFKIYSERVYLRGYSYARLKENIEIEEEYLQENGHEAFPVVSEFWLEVLLRFPLSKWNRLSNLKDDISEKTFWYLNNSEMIPRRKLDSRDYGADESIKDLDRHIKTCYKSAIILMQNSAIQMHTKLAASNKPVYMGKDILIENVIGYKYTGYFPAKLLLRIKYSFQMGVIEWWQKHLKWYLALKTNIDVHTQANSNNRSDNEESMPNKSKFAAYILSVFVAVGLTISTLVFILFDSHLLKNTYNCLWVTFRMPTEYVSKLPGSNIQPKEMVTNTCQKPQKIYCPFCPLNHLSTDFEHMKDIELHLSITHPEHFFLNILDTEAKIESLRDLCNMLLTSEFETAVTVDNKKEKQYMCPYCLNDTVLTNKAFFRLHLLKIHNEALVEKLRTLNDFNN